MIFMNSVSILLLCSHDAPGSPLKALQPSAQELHGRMTTPDMPVNLVKWCYLIAKLSVVKNDRPVIDWSLRVVYILELVRVQLHI